MNDDDAKRLIALVDASLDLNKLMLVEMKMLREDIADMRGDLHTFRTEVGQLFLDHDNRLKALEA
jgi:hypothetical protein